MSVSPEDERVDPAPRPETAPPRDHSPVIEGRDRSRLPMIMAFIVIAGVLGFLFVTSGAKEPPSVAAAPQLAATDNKRALDHIAEPPPLPPAPAVPAGLPPPPTPTTPDSRGRNKEDARRHAPVLVYDVSRRSSEDPETETARPANADDLQALITSAAAHDGAADARPEEDSSSPSRAEGQAQRNQEFAREAASEAVPIVSAKRIELHNRIAQGKTLAATLETAISSDLPGKLRAVVSRDIWSEDGSQRLILRGSRLIGDYRAGLARGQTRVLVIWTRLLQPDGTDIALGSPGTDDLGRAGLSGRVDRHFAERFGAAFLLSIIGSATVIAQDGNGIIVDTSRSAAGVAGDSLQDSVDIPPTITVAQGAPVQVLVSRDLVFDRAPQVP